MDNQTLFNNAWQHFIVGDGQPAFSVQDKMCWYLTADGRKCAIGVSIPDGQNGEQIEHIHVGKLIRSGAVPALKGADVNFAINLQDCHDIPAREGYIGDKFKASMKLRMEVLADKYGLQVPA